jgi:chromosome segregation ATPase
LLLGVSLGRSDTPAPAESPESVRALLSKWSETQQILSKEREEWKQGKEVLLSRIELLKSEVAALEGKSSEASKGTQDVRKERQQLLSEQEVLKGTSEDLARLAAEMEGKIRSLQPKLPDPLKEKIGPLYSRCSPGCIPAAGRALRIGVAPLRSTVP